MVAQEIHLTKRPHSRRHGACEVCGGVTEDKRGRGERCYGVTYEESGVVICTREEYAGTLTQNPRSGGWHHRMTGACPCGVEHGATLPEVKRASDAPRRAFVPDRPTRAHQRVAPSEVYEYRALDDGATLRKLRFGYGKGKYFVWQRPDDAGDWLDCKGDRPTPDAYRAQLLDGADPFAPLFITEGEKDADKLARLGAVVISPPDGTGSWRDEYSRMAAGRQVIICADNDAPGRAHAEQVAQSIAAHALTVRVILFDDAHDVGDWLDAGHTFDELRTLAAHTPVITAQLPQSQNPCPAPQDGTPTQTLKSCSNCQTWQDRARIAETSLENLRKERAIASRILALPKEQLSPALKPAAIAVREILTRPKARDDAGMEQVYRAQIAQRCGVSDKTAGAYLRDLAEAGIIRREVTKSFDTSEIRISEGPLFDEPEQVEAQPKTWGGRRVKVCVACGSDNLETRVVCRECGTLQSAEDTNKPDHEPEPPDGSDAPQSQNPCPAPQDGTPMEEAQDAPTAASTSPSGNTLVAQLDANAQEDADERADLLTLAETLGWPRIPLDLQHIIGGSAPTWRDFADNASPEDLATILYRLKAKYAALCGDKE